MKFSDLPDNETLRLARELSQNRSALNATQQFMLDRRNPAFDQTAIRAFEEIRRQQNSFVHKHALDLFSGAGSALRPAIAQLFLSNAQQATMEALKGIGSTALSQTVREASAVLLFQQQHLFRNATMEAVRSLWRFDNPAFQALRADAFAGTLMNYVREHATASEKAIEELQEIVDEKVAKLPRGRISADGILNLIMTVILFLATIAYNEVRDGRRTQTPALSDAQIERVIESIAKAQTLIPENDNSTYYVVERPVAIRLKPNNRSAAVAGLYPNQKVRLVQSSHQWIYVEYFDYIEGIPKLGWVNKKYLEKLV